MEEVPCRTSLTPLASPCFQLCIIVVETERLLDYQGRAGIMSIVRWNLRPVIFGVDQSASKSQRSSRFAIAMTPEIASDCGDNTKQYCIAI